MTTNHELTQCLDLEIRAEEVRKISLTNQTLEGLQRAKQKIYPIEVLRHHANSLVQEITELRREIESETKPKNHLEQALMFKASYNLEKKATGFAGILQDIESRGIMKLLQNSESSEIVLAPNSYTQRLIKLEKRLSKIENDPRIKNPNDNFRPDELLKFIGGSAAIGVIFYLLGDLDALTIETLEKIAEATKNEQLEQIEHFLNSIEKSAIWHEYLKYVFNLFGSGYLIRKTHLQTLLPEGTKPRQILRFIANNTKMDFNSEGDGEKHVQNVFFIWLLNKFLHTPFVH
jgi:hypothetical protein